MKVRNVPSAKLRHTKSRVGTCFEPKSWLFLIELCSVDIHYGAFIAQNLVPYDNLNENKIHGKPNKCILLWS